MPGTFLSRRSRLGTIVACVVVFVAGGAAPGRANPMAYIPLGGIVPTGSPTGLAIVDVATGARVGTIPLSVAASAIAINPSGTRAYVVDVKGVAVINLKTRAVVKTISDVGAVTVAVDPSGTRAYVTNQSTNTLDVINTGTNTITKSIPVGTQPRGLVVNTAGTRAYTGNTMTPYSISVVSLTTDTDLTDVSSANLNRPENLGIAPSGSAVYAANFGASAGGTTVGVLNPSDNSVRSVPVGTTPTSVMVNPSGSTGYVANRDSDSLSLIDTASSTNVGTVPLSFSPLQIAIGPGGTRAVITGQDPNTGHFEAAIFDLVNNKVVAGPTKLPPGNGVAIAPADHPVPAIKVTTGRSKDTKRFDATGSSGGPIVRYDWRFGDGKTAPNGGATVAHTYAKAGTYTVRLTETDGCARNAVFGPLRVSFNGNTAFCMGRRTSTKTVTVRIPNQP
jgi:YVTN family beta-propeller protein